MAPPGTGQPGDRSETKPESPVAGVPRHLLTVEDLAVILGLSVRGARQVLERGELPGFRVGRRWYLRREDLDAAIAAKVAGQRQDRASQRDRVPRRDPDAAVRILRGVPAARRAAGSP